MKAKQPGLAEEIETAFSAPETPAEAVARETEFDEVTTTNGGHGRIETRRLEATTVLRGHPEWSGLEQVCRITRTREVNGKETTKTVHAITSLPRETADAAALLRLSRGHWGIENRLHYVRDMTFREDQSRIRTGNAPQVHAAIRNTAMTLIRRLGFHCIPEALENFAEHRQKAVHLVRYARTE